MILIMDANKHVMDRAMYKQLTGNDLQMSETVHSETGDQGPKTWLRGSEFINGLWVSPEIDDIEASYLPFD